MNAIFTLHNKLERMLPTFPSLKSIPKDFCATMYLPHQLQYLYGKLVNSIIDMPHECIP